MTARMPRGEINVRLIYSPWDGFRDKILAMATAGQMPDVVVLSQIWLPRFAESRLVRPLDGMAPSGKFGAKRELTDTKLGHYCGKFYGFPIWCGPAISYYNRAMFTNAGVPDPNQLIEAAQLASQGK